jgi:hypothetical protein
MRLYPLMILAMSVPALIAIRLYPIISQFLGAW